MSLNKIHLCCIPIS